jgi:hypothetical protein
MVSLDETKKTKFGIKLYPKKELNVNRKIKSFLEELEGTLENI